MTGTVLCYGAALAVGGIAYAISLDVMSYGGASVVANGTALKARAVEIYPEKAAGQALHSPAMGAILARKSASPEAVLAEWLRDVKMEAK